MNSAYKQLQEFAEAPLEVLLTKVAELYGSEAAFSTSFSNEDQLISHVIFSENLPIRVFTLDTGRLFSETYAVFNQTRNRYKHEIEVFSPKGEAVELMLSAKGPFSFYDSLENRKECCAIRKIEPLNRALTSSQCWITGQRAEHSENRQGLALIEWDEKRQLVKINPLANWTSEQVKVELKKHNIPYNVLTDKGFVSIGCQPCTRAIQAGEDFRAGRWWWENNSKKECGLHA